MVPFFSLLESTDKTLIVKSSWSAAFAAWLRVLPFTSGTILSSDFGLDGGGLDGRGFGDEFARATISPISTTVATKIPEPTHNPVRLLGRNTVGSCSVCSGGSCSACSGESLRLTC